MAKTNKLGLCLRRKKKDFLGQKLSKKLSLKAKNWPIIKKKKKGHFRPKKQAVAELKNKKRTFLGKYCKKNWVLRPKIDQFKKKRDISGQNKQAGAELNKKKKDFLGQKLGIKLSIKNWF